MHRLLLLIFSLFLSFSLSLFFSNDINESKTCDSLLSIMLNFILVFSCFLHLIFAALVLYLASGLGITAGAHRLWAHRSYKARLPLRVLLTIFNTIAFQDCAIHWARDHRVHHKYSETDADPHNATRYVCSALFVSITIHSENLQ